MNTNCLFNMASVADVAISDVASTSSICTANLVDSTKSCNNGVCIHEGDVPSSIVAPDDFAIVLSAYDPDAYGIPGIKKIVHKDRATTIHWEDGKKTTVVCGENETYDKYTGFMAAVCKRLFGTTTTAKRICKKKDNEHLKQQEEKENEKRRLEKAERQAIEDRRTVKRMAKEMLAARHMEELARQAEELANRMAEKQSD